MLIRKRVDIAPNNNLMVDNWKVQYLNDPITDSCELKETYSGLALMKKTEEQKYLGLFSPARGTTW